MPQTAYCGSPPTPASLGWNGDPLLLAALLVMAVLLWRACRGAGRLRTGMAAAGWVLLVLALVSPLCNLSVALFSARVGQHMLMTLVAAPLIAFGAVPARPLRAAPSTLLPALVFAAGLWIWHLPQPYGATFRSDALYWAMHATLFGTALWLWAALRMAVGVRPDLAAVSALATGVQMGLLGALLTLAQRPLFVSVHAEGITAPWGLSPLEDQQLGGLLMWVPGGLLLAVICLASLAQALRAEAATAPLPPRSLP